MRHSRREAFNYNEKKCLNFRSQYFNGINVHLVKYPRVKNTKLAKTAVSFLDSSVFLS